MGETNSQTLINTLATTKRKKMKILILPLFCLSSMVQLSFAAPDEADVANLRTMMWKLLQMPKRSFSSPSSAFMNAYLRRKRALPMAQMRLDQQYSAPFNGGFVPY